MRSVTWTLLALVGTNICIAASSDANGVPEARYPVTTARADDIFHRQLDPEEGQCCGMCTQLILNPAIVLLLVAFESNNGGQLNPSLLVPSVDITVLMRMTIVYTDNNAADTTLQVTKIFDVEVLPDAWNEPCSYTDNCIIFENEEVRLFAPTTVGGFAVLSLESVNEFSASSDVTIVSSSCDLRCAEDVLCDSFELSGGDLDPDGLGISFGSISQSAFNSGFCIPSIFADPHVNGLRGQRYDWSGVDGGWYAFIVTDLFQMNLRVTSYLPDTFPDRQLITGVALVIPGKHSIKVEVVEPLDFTSTCEEDLASDGADTGKQAACLVNGALRVTVDGRDEMVHAGEFKSDGNIDIAAINLPLECQRFGDYRMWVSFTDEQRLMHPESRMLRAKRARATGLSAVLDWLVSDPAMIAAPWCKVYVEKFAAEVHQLTGLHSEHAVFRIETPEVLLRVNVGINVEEELTLEDGRIVPPSKFWQMDVSVERAVDLANAKGMLGETARYVLDESGKPVMTGLGVIRGQVEDYRVKHPLGMEFNQLFVPET